MQLIKDNLHWLLRIYLAFIFIPIGYGKLGVMVNEMKIVGYLVGPFEFIGPLLIIFGVFTKDIVSRIGGAMIAIIMMGAIYLHIFSWGDGILDVTWQIFLLISSLLFVVRGNKIFE